MPKDALYFSHDSNAHNDPKCLALRKDFGLHGYGVYWFLVEVLHEQGGYIQRFPKMIDGLAFELRIENEALLRIIEAMVREYELLQMDEKSIWSERVLRNLQARQKKSEAKAEAGRLGGKKSGLVRASAIEPKQNEAVLEANEAVLEANEQKKRKERKERKEKKDNISREVDQDFTNQLAAEYPRVNIDEEKRLAEEWVADHPGRKFSRSFFRGWIKRTNAKLPPPDPNEYTGPFLNADEEAADRAADWVMAEMEKDEERRRQQLEEEARNG